MRALSCFALLSVAAANPTAAQGDSTGLHATLHAWADDAWFAIVHRDAAPGGRLSNQGILQRFQPTIDPDYQINLIRIRFGLLDDYDWYRHGNGGRCYAGSLNTTHFAEGCEFKQSVPLGTRWSADLHFNTADLPEVSRSLPRLGFIRTAESGFFLSLESTLVPFKPHTAIEAGTGWRRAGRELAVFVGVIDAFNNFIYGGLGLTGTAARDTMLDYDRQPLTVRVNVDQSIGAKWRVESRAGVMRPATLRAYPRYSPDSGFRQDEGYGFAGILVEHQPIGRLTMGVFATYIQAVTDRTPLPDGRALDDFRLTERTGQAGGLLLARLPSHCVLESWLGRNWRPQWQVYRRGAAPDVDYEDAAWSGQAAFASRPEQGFTGSVAYDFDLRDVLPGAGEVPGTVEAPYGRHNNEIRLEFGWRAVNQYTFELGLAVDTDPGPYGRGWFGGGEGRFVLYW